MAIFSGKFERVVFIVSTGRTGTKALAQHLSSCYANVCALHEPRPSWRLRRATTRALSGNIVESELVELLAGSRRAMVAGVEKPMYVESNPYLSGFLPAFRQVFDNVRVVHLVRDPRTYVRSGVNFGAFRGAKRLAAHLVPWWFPHPEQFQGESLRWSEMDAIVRLAWFWKIVNNHLNRGAELYGPHYLRLRFEDLFAADGAGLDQLTDFIGLPRSPALKEEAGRESVNASRGDILPPWEKWGAADQQKVLSLCADLMALYGYERASSQATVAT